MTSLTQKEVQRIADECRMHDTCSSCNGRAVTRQPDEDYPEVWMPLCERCCGGVAKYTPASNVLENTRRSREKHPA